MDEPAGSSDRYRAAQLNFAVRGVAAIAGEMRRRGEINTKTDEEICGLMNQLRHAAQATLREDVFEEATSASHLLGMTDRDQ